MGVGGQRHAPAALPPGKTRCLLHRRISLREGRPGRLRKISPPTGFDPRTVRPVASRYTVCDPGPRPSSLLLDIFFTMDVPLTNALSKADFPSLYDYNVSSLSWFLTTFCWYEVCNHSINHTARFYVHTRVTRGLLRHIAEKYLWGCVFTTPDVISWVLHMQIFLDVRRCGLVNSYRRL